MVKADLDRDYYADLEIEQTATINDIKKQFRKLALLYHPDRNLGKEIDITAKFQAIQSAHEILTDPSERARYDEARSRFRYTSASAFRAHTKGNPYSNYGAEFQRPPKPPPYRGGTKNPPQSAGAAKYANFYTPKQPPSAAAQEGAEARKSTFHAWESMKGHQRPTPSSSSSSRPGPGSTWSTPKAVPKEYTPQSGREESNSYRHPPPPKPRPGYEEFRSSQATGSFGDRNQSTSGPRRTGFDPNNPGLDEPAAGNRNNYFTSRSNRDAPEPPPREVPSYNDTPPVNRSTRPSVKTNDPLRQFRETEDDASYEPRLSTPYANAGGEKFDPFDTANLNRSKSTRDGFARSDSKKHVNRSGSDPNLASPHENGTSKPPRASAVSPDSSSLSDNSAEVPGQSRRTRPFAKPRKAPPVREQTEPIAPTRPQSERKPSTLSSFQKWLRENSSASHQINDLPSDGTSASATKDANSTKNGTKPEPSMYGRSPTHPIPDTRERSHHVKRATVSGAPLHHPLSFSTRVQNAYKDKFPDLFQASGKTWTTAPLSGASTRSFSAFNSSQEEDADEVLTGSPTSIRNLHPFEAVQHDLVDQLLFNKQQVERSRRKSKSFSDPLYREPDTHPVDKPSMSRMNSSAKMSSMAKQQDFENKCQSTSSFNPAKQQDFVNKCQSASSFTQPRFSSLLQKLQAHANGRPETSFSLKLDDETFSPTKPTAFPRGSADNINTKFSSEEWHGKFEAGGDYFVPEQKTNQVPVHSRARAQSGSRSRGRSPIKVRPVDPKVFPAPKSETPIESPGGTVFSAQEWEETFKPQTFAPPAFSTQSKSSVPSRVGSRKTRAQTAKPTAGSAAVLVDDDEDSSSDEKPLFKGRAGKTPQTTATGSSSPDAMDVDTPPIAPQPQPQMPAQSPKANGNLKINTEPLKRAAASSLSPVDAEMKIRLGDLKLEDMLSSLDLPKPPSAPRYSHDNHSAMAQGIYLSAFTAYMGDWDLYSTRMMLHLVARKNQNKSLGSFRWESAKGLDNYRTAVSEDAAVLSHWVAALAAHDQVMKQFAIHQEQFSMAEHRERERPRKKTH